MINQKQLKSILAIHLHLLLFDVSFAPGREIKAFSINFDMAQNLMTKLYFNYPNNSPYEKSDGQYLSNFIPISLDFLQRVPTSSLIIFSDYFIGVIDRFSGY